jgi:class 3 adenylate cyclase
MDAALPLFRAALGATVNSLSTGSHWPFAPDAAAALAAEGRVEDLRAWVADVSVLTVADPNPHNQASDRLCAGHLHAAAGELDGAREAYTDAAQRYAAMPCPARTAEAYLGLADVEWLAGSPEPSVRAARQAASIADTLGAPSLARAAKRAVDRADEPPVLATVLFTDIVGSTERATALGDVAWRALLERHHAIVRRELARSRGREIDTAGDGFLIAFDTPAHAIRCASAISDGLAQAGIPIRAGLHTGECQQDNGKLTGVTVHIAARVSSLAGAGEVLVSQTVRDLVTGSGLEFTDRGRHTLKGVPGEWQLYAVRH